MLHAITPFIDTSERWELAVDHQTFDCQNNNPPNRTLWGKSMLGFLTALITAAPVAQEAWTLRAEREVDEGVYMQVVAAQSGWRIWRVETRSGVSCSAVKSARGRSHPYPIGVGSALYGGSPFVEVRIGRENTPFSYQWRGQHFGGVRVKYRTPGARFWEEVEPYPETDFASFADQPVEVNVVSYEYPSIYEGRADETAILDFAGLTWAQEQVTACQTPQPS